MKKSQSTLLRVFSLLVIFLGMGTLAYMGTKTTTTPPPQTPEFKNQTEQGINFEQQRGIFGKNNETNDAIYTPGTKYIFFQTVESETEPNSSDCISPCTTTNFSCANGRTINNKQPANFYSTVSWKCKRKTHNIDCSTTCPKNQYWNGTNCEKKPHNFCNKTTTSNPQGQCVDGYRVESLPSGKGVKCSVGNPGSETSEICCDTDYTMHNGDCVKLEPGKCGTLNHTTNSDGDWNGREESITAELQNSNILPSERGYCENSEFSWSGVNTPSSEPFKRKCKNEGLAANCMMCPKNTVYENGICDFTPTGGGNSCPTGCVKWKYRGGCRKTCFIAGTQVLTNNGNYKNIEDIVVGDKIIGMNNSINTVLELKRHPLGNQPLYSINKKEAFVTAEHPFLTTEGWKSINPILTKQEMDIPIDILKIGDTLITKDGKEKIYSIIPHKSENQTVYNLTVNNTHTYSANNYIVHNKTAAKPGSNDACPPNMYKEDKGCYYNCQESSPSTQTSIPICGFCENTSQCPLNSSCKSINEGEKVCHPTSCGPKNRYCDNEGHIIPCPAI